MEAERQRNNAREEVTAAQKRLDESHREVSAILDRAQHDARSERDRILAEARVDGERLLHNANGELTRGRAAGREMYRDALLREALRIAGERAGSEVDDASNMNIIDGVLNAVESDVVAA